MSVGGGAWINGGGVSCPGSHWRVDILHLDEAAVSVRAVRSQVKKTPEGHDPQGNVVLVFLIGQKWASQGLFVNWSGTQLSSVAPGSSLYSFLR